MGVVIKDLRSPVQPIAEKIRGWGFTMIDIISIGLLFLEDKNANEVASLIESLSKTKSDSISFDDIKSLQIAMQMIKDMLDVERQQHGTIYRVLTAEQQSVLQEFIKEVSPDFERKKKKKKA